ncbi:AmmeMemoRadiSam system protein B [Shewanella psychropiezotolerans]|uniref:MEMO1 family protein FM037_22775 n=1 Tax=Shewanella psychropiezotolerans TaxID=2593655 RepID=A0ABX5X2K5_9GAMM|nr:MULTISPECIES: AmmeMemoRadiSam system protein B [Shewanella]MPY23494.1 AmmeMemoRadiSam system protein B [Shewanella sp. YLB-07]QDO85570.1 AmmeMemoRadiSam system protein B [Shewanella psychropiezotolerans]
MLSSIRPPAVAGLFYPADPIVLSAELSSYMSHASLHKIQHSTPKMIPKAIIVPHAGYIYSGLVAAHGFSCISAITDKIKRVVLLGPAHTLYLQGCAIPESTHFSTPLGNLPIDSSGAEKLAAYDAVTISNIPHKNEHSLEVELPFLQHCLDEFTLLPILVGDIAPELMAELLELVWGGDETLIVVSSDLSHFHPYDEAKQLDRETCQKILANNSDISSEQACGGRSLNALSLQIMRHNLNITQLSYQNSGDCATSDASDKSRVVGYASFAIS